MTLFGHPTQFDATDEPFPQPADDESVRGRVEAYHRRAALCLRVESAAVHDDTTATADVTESWPRRSDDSGEVIVLEVPPLGQDVAGSVVDSESEGSPAKSEEETGRHCSGDAIVPLPFEDAARPLAGLGAASHPRGDRAARDAPPAEDAPREDLPSLSLGLFTVGGLFSLGTGDSLLGRIADVPPAIPPINLNDAYKNYDSVDEDGDADEDEEEADDEDEERGCIPAEVTVGVSLPEPPEEHAGEQPPPLPPPVARLAPAARANPQRRDAAAAGAAFERLRGAADPWPNDPPLLETPFLTEFQGVPICLHYDAPTTVAVETIHQEGLCIEDTGPPGGGGNVDLRQFMVGPHVFSMHKDYVNVVSSA